MTSEQGLRRRDVLVVGAAAAGGIATSGCAILRGGAVHPIYAKSEAALRDGVLHIPLADLEGARGGGVLEIRPGSGFPDVLVTSNPPGEYLAVTSKCPHKGCVVDFAPAARQWRCPCHGSHFSATGEVVDGPAKSGLRAPPVEVQGDALLIQIAALATAEHQ